MTLEIKLKIILVSIAFAAVQFWALWYFLFKKESIYWIFIFIGLIIIQQAIIGFIKC